MKVITQEFYTSFDTIELSKKLLGKLLIREIGDKTLIGRIVETEAYLFDDPAAHSFKGISKRNKSLFEEAGTCYVYLIYGIHYCLNIVSSKKGVGEAVLIRALEPVEGLSPSAPTNGPGKLCKALLIDLGMDGHKSWLPPLYLCQDEISDKVTQDQIISTRRIGITKAKDLLYRFYLKDSGFVSRT